MATPNKSKTKGSNKLSSLNPNAFDGQMLLVDMFLGNVSFPKQRLRRLPAGKLKKFASNVPFADFSNINEMMDLNMAAAQNFIDSVTPLEYAQMHPAIALSVIDVDDDNVKPVYLPLSAPADLNSGGLTKGNAHYNTNAFGLKSMEMVLDGSEQPFFSKSYFVTIEFIFDSMNTFTSNIPGLAEGVTYARLLKSAGRIGESSLALKADIAYSTNNKDITEKYALGTPQMGFSLILHFLRSVVTIKENLQVSVKVEYISREEEIFSSVQLYDILALNIAASQKKYENLIDTTNLKLDALILADAKIAAATKAELQADTQALRSELAKLKTRKVMLESGKTKSEMREVYSPNSGLIGSIKDVARGVSNYISGVNDDIEDLDEKILELSARANRNENLIKGGDEKLLKEVGYSQKRQEIQEQLEKKRKKAYKKLQNIRHDQIIESLNEIFEAGYDLDAIREIKVNQEGLIKYYGDALKNQTRTKTQLLQSAKNLTTPPTSGGATTATTSAVTTGGNVNMGTSSQANAANQFDQQIQKWQEELKDESTIQYILLGDLIRLIFKKLLSNINTVAKNSTSSSLSGNALLAKQNLLRRNLEKGIILLPNIEIDNIQKGSLEKRNLYFFPISIKHLRYIFATELFGKNNTTFTLFELVEKIAELLSITRKRKEQVLNVQTSNVSFRLKKSTYPVMIKSGKKLPRATKSKSYKTMLANLKAAADRYVIFTDNPLHRGNTRISNYKYGIILNIQKMRQTSSASGNLPRFIFGGSPTGIIKKFNLLEFESDDLQKFVMEETMGNADVIIPSFYQISIDTLMCPIFQLGMDVEVLAPTITAGSRESGLFIAGKYQLGKVIHRYSATGFSTSIQGTMYSDPTSTVDAIMNTVDNKESRLNLVANQIYEAVLPGINKIGQDGARLRTGKAPELVNQYENINFAAGGKYNSNRVEDSIEQGLKSLED